MSSMLKSLPEPAQPYHPESRALLEKIAGLGVEEAPYKSGTPAEVRAKYKELEKASRAMDLTMFNGDRREFFVPVSGSSGIVKTKLSHVRSSQ
jgi:hypothetical protein